MNFKEWWVSSNVRNADVDINDAEAIWDAAINEAVKAVDKQSDSCDPIELNGLCLAVNTLLKLKV